MNVERYLHIPFTNTGAGWDGCNCWGLICLIYREELGISLPLFNGVPATSLREATRLFQAHNRQWAPVDDPQPYDVVGMRGASVINGRSLSLQSHVGIVADGGLILHTEAGVGPAVLPITDPLIAPRIVEFRRYAP